jgi:hypothetical protein
MSMSAGTPGKVSSRGVAGFTYTRARGLWVPQRAGTVGARKLSKSLGLGSSLCLPSRAPTTRGQARWSTYIHVPGRALLRFAAS